MKINNHTLYRAGTRFIDTEELGFAMPTQGTMNSMKKEDRKMLINEVEKIIKEATPFFYGELGEYLHDEYLYFYSEKCHAIIIKSLIDNAVITIFVPYSSPEITWKKVLKLLNKLKPDFIKLAEEIEEINNSDSKDIIKEQTESISSRIKTLCAEYKKDASEILCKYKD